MSNPGMASSPVSSQLDIFTKSVMPWSTCTPKRRRLFTGATMNVAKNCKKKTWRVEPCVSTVDHLESFFGCLCSSCRDIKPENILLDKDQHAKLADFGWSNVLENVSYRLVFAVLSSSFSIFSCRRRLGQTSANCPVLGESYQSIQTFVDQWYQCMPIPCVDFVGSGFVIGYCTIPHRST